MMKKYFIVLLILIFASCSRRNNQEQDDYINDAETEAILAQTPPPPPVIERLVYIALGDSVSEGFGMWSYTDRHTSVFFEMLKEHNIANEYVNMAVSGFTTSDVLYLLENLSPQELEYFKHASIITLNIGGNNILAPLWEQLPDPTEVPSIINEATDFVANILELVQEILSFVEESREAITDVLYFANEVSDFAENFSILDVFRLNEMMATAPPIIDGAMEVFAEVDEIETAVTQMFEQVQDLKILDLYALLIGDFSNEMEWALHSSIRSFTREFNELLDWILLNAPDANVIVNTVYNPLPTDLAGLQIGFANEAQRFIQALNTVIYEQSTTRGFIVSDIYSVLSHRLDMMIFNLDLIHPNPQGHYEIARVNFDDLMRSVFFLID